MNIITMELLTIIVLMAVYDDLLRYKISNKIIALGVLISGIHLGVYVVLGMIVDKGFLLWIDVLAKNSLLGMLVGFFGMFVIYIFGAVGAGDVKLMGVIGLIGGIKLVQYVLLYSLIAGGILGILGIWLKRCDRVDRYCHIGKGGHATKYNCINRYDSIGKYGMKVHIMHYSLAIALGLAFGMLKILLSGGDFI